MDFINQVICGDSREVLKHIPDESVDLIIADPPYGINYQSAWRIDSERFDHIQGDETIQTDWIKDCHRILKPNTAIYIFTRWNVYPKWYEAVKQHFIIKNVLIWDRIIHGLGDLEGAYAYCYDMIIFAVKGRPILKNGRPKDVLHYQRPNPLDLVHPTEKPIELMSELITNSSNEGDLILDPFAGSGAIGVAATLVERNHISVELEEKYCEIARKRIEKARQSKSYKLETFQ